MAAAAVAVAVVEAEELWPLKEARAGARAEARAGARAEARAEARAAVLGRRGSANRLVAVPQGVCVAVKQAVSKRGGG